MTTFFKAIAIALLAGASFLANAASCIGWMFDFVYTYQMVGGLVIQALVLHWLSLTLNQFDGQPDGTAEPTAGSIH